MRVSAREPQREATGLVTALNPCRKLGCLQSDAGAVAVAGEDRSGLGQGQQTGRNRLDDGVEVAVGASGCAGAAVEEGVAGEDDAFAVLPAEGGGVEAHGAGGVAGGGEDLQLGIADAYYIAVGQFVVEVPGGIHHFPEHTVRGV